MSPLKQSSWRGTVVLGTIAVVFAAIPISAQICSTRAPSTPNIDLDGGAKFFVHRSGALNDDLRYRDAEFMWDSLYATGLSLSVQATLKNFGHFLAESVGTSPLVRNARNTQAVFNYLNRENHTWLPEPGDLSVGLRVGDASYSLPDLSHVDAYITHWNRDMGGQQPSRWYVLDEDLSSEHEYGDVAHLNSIHMGGPNPTTPLDLDGTGWTLPRSPQFVRFNHEMSHALIGNDVECSYAELWAAAAEVRAGYRGRLNSKQRQTGSETGWCQVLWTGCGGAGDSRYQRLQTGDRVLHGVLCCIQHIPPALPQADGIVV